MTIRPELLDELLKDYTKPEDLVGEGGLLKQLTKALAERCLETEMDVHLDDPKYRTEKKARGDRRNGHSQKTIKGEFGQATLDIPRDRNGEFEPVIVKKGQMAANRRLSCDYDLSRDRATVRSSYAAFLGGILVPLGETTVPNPHPAIYQSLAAQPVMLERLVWQRRGSPHS